MNCKAKNVRQVRQILSTIVLAIFWLCLFFSHYNHIYVMYVQSVFKMYVEFFMCSSLKYFAKVFIAF
jgi:hypothetical protein